MKNVRSIQLIDGSNEELLPDISPDFPYIASRALLDSYVDGATPWHWHRAVELFYMDSGKLEYTTPGGSWVFPSGYGGFVNSNVLHTSRILPSGSETIQLLHLVEPELLGGGDMSRISTRYIRPLVSSGTEMICLSPYVPEQAAILQMIREAFDLDESRQGYEMALRSRLCEIWLALMNLSQPSSARELQNNGADEKMKSMMRYIHAHFSEFISVDDLAREAHISKRVCYRLFQQNLHMSPVSYMTKYRLRKACILLKESDKSVTQIAYACGLGSSSYFGKLFRENFGCSPSVYRKKWQDRDII